MSAPAAIQASLVDVRNIAAHKCVRLEIHVPVEQASVVMAAFGWPTAADPVPVAIARLNLSEAASAPEKPRQSWADMKPSAQAGMRCNEPAFRRWLAKDDPEFKMYDLDMAADAVRERCDVHSRAHLDTNKQAAAIWQRMEAEYQDWRRCL